MIVAVIAFSRMARKQVKESSSYNEDGDGHALMKGRGSDYDSSKVLLDRLEWSTYYESRISRWYRMIVITIIVIVLISLLALRKLPKPSTLVIMFVAIFIPFYATHNFYYTHGDIYNDYYMWDNIQRLRKRLKEHGEYCEPPPPHPHSRSPNRVQAMNQE